MIVIGVYLISQKELTMGALIASSMLAGRALAPAGQIVGLLMQYQGARTAMDASTAHGQAGRAPARPDLRPAARCCAARSSSATSSSPTPTGRIRRSTA
jgi:ABC-type multidrug transport system fused ATPase/permease subunit